MVWGGGIRSVDTAFNSLADRQGSFHNVDSIESKFINENGMNYVGMKNEMEYSVKLNIPCGKKHSP